MMPKCELLHLVVAFGWVCLAPSDLAYGSTLPVYRESVGGVVTHTVQPAETLMAIAGRLGVQWQAVAALNSLGNPDRIYPGQRLQADTTRIVPALLDDGIVVNIPEATIYYFERGRLVFRAGVGLGRPKVWETLQGVFTIVTKERHPTWVVPTSIQHEMEAEGRVVFQRLPRGPDNPLGEFWLGLSLAGFGIHGTIEPSSIGQYRSHGCIRMHPEDIRALFSLVNVGTPGKIIYQPVKIAAVAGKIYVEAHHDVYGSKRRVSSKVYTALQALGYRIDWNHVESVLHNRSGTAEVVTGSAN